MEAVSCAKFGPGSTHAALGDPGHFKIFLRVRAVPVRAGRAPTASRWPTVALPPKALDLLAALISSAGHLVTKEDLLKQVWPDTFVEEANLSYTISLLRKALGDDESPHRYIETVPRRGYRFIRQIADVTAAETRAPPRTIRRARAVETSHASSTHEPRQSPRNRARGRSMADQGARGPGVRSRVVPLTTLSGFEGGPRSRQTATRSPLSWGGEQGGQRRTFT